MFLYNVLYLRVFVVFLMSIISACIPASFNCVQVNSILVAHSLLIGRWCLLCRAFKPSSFPYPYHLRKERACSARASCMLHSSFAHANVLWFSLHRCDFTRLLVLHFKPVPPSLPRKTQDFPALSWFTVAIAARSPQTGCVEDHSPWAFSLYEPTVPNLMWVFTIPLAIVQINIALRGAFLFSSQVVEWAPPCALHRLHMCT